MSFKILDFNGTQIWPGPEPISFMQKRTPKPEKMVEGQQVIRTGEPPRQDRLDIRTRAYGDFDPTGKPFDSDSNK